MSGAASGLGGVASSGGNMVKGGLSGKDETASTTESAGDKMGKAQGTAVDKAGEVGGKANEAAGSAKDTAAEGGKKLGLSE